MGSPNEKQSNSSMARDLLWDGGKDLMRGQALDWLGGKLKVPLEVAGDLVGAGKFGAKAAGAFASSAATAAIDLAEGGYKIMKEGARDGDTKAGEELLKKPAWYQVGRQIFSPADNFSEFGAKMEADQRAIADAEVGMMNKDAEKMFQSAGVADTQIEERRRAEDIERERLAREAFEDEHLGEITMNMVAKYVRGGV